MAKIDTLTDNFDDNSSSGSWSDSSGGGGTIAEQNQRVELDISGGSQFAQRESASSYDITASAMYARVIRVPNGASLWPHITFAALDAQGDGYGWYSDLGVSLRARRWYASGASETDAIALTHDDTDHAWLRIREASGTMYWETAPDSGGSPGTWTVQASESTHADFAPSAMKARMRAASGLAGEVYFDGFNTAVTGTPSINQSFHRRMRHFFSGV